MREEECESSNSPGPCASMLEWAKELLMEEE